MNQEEKWIPIIGYEGAYEMSNNLRIRSLDRVVRCGYNKTRIQKGKIIIPTKKECGRKFINLCKNGVSEKFALSRLIALQFIPNPNNLKVVDHINNDQSDDSIENLQWITNADNIKKGYYDGKNHKIGNKGTPRKILQYSLNGEFVAEHCSVSNAQRLFTPNSKRATISNHLINPSRQKSAHGFIWKYKTESNE